MQEEKVNKEEINQHTPKASNDKLEFSSIASQGSVTGVKIGSRNHKLTKEAGNNAMVIWKPSEEHKLETTGQEEEREGNAVPSNEQILDFDDNKRDDVDLQSQQAVPSVVISELITKRAEATRSSPTLSQSSIFSLTRQQKIPSSGHELHRNPECTRRRLERVKRREEMLKLFTSLSCRELQQRNHHRWQVDYLEEKGNVLTFE
ncbi:hypothetical protein HAX54_042232 [Datura stramonium]|uniref:Uncharacterized protein n=1 Tax=Datura stramonium TaxID=4076 RepID=A0ABS8VYT3_DATST|nr:hypothetical protein [Datura stramonium]